jgi:hypothetical protein
MLMRNGSRSVGKERCDVACGIPMCLKGKLLNALNAKWVIRWPSRPYILTDPIGLDIL